MWKSKIPYKNSVTYRIKKMRKAITSAVQFKVPEQSILDTDTSDGSGVIISPRHRRSIF